MYCGSCTKSARNVSCGGFVPLFLWQTLAFQTAVPDGMTVTAQCPRLSISSSSTSHIRMPLHPQPTLSLRQDYHPMLS